MKKTLFITVWILFLLIPNSKSFAICTNCKGWYAGERSLAVSPDGSKAWVSFSGDDAVVAVDLNNMKFIGGVDVSSAGLMLDSRTSRLNADGTRLFVANYGPKNVMVIDTTSNTVIDILDLDPNHGDSIHAVSDGRMLITSMSADQAFLHVVDSADLTYDTYILPGLANAWVVPDAINPNIVFGVAKVGLSPNYKSVFFSFEMSSGLITKLENLPETAQPSAGNTECNRLLLDSVCPRDDNILI